MTRREKILLQICIAIGLIGLGSMYLLRPSITEKNEAVEALELAELQEVQIMTVLNAQGVEDTLAEQKALAEQNYEYFYGELNSYTIDEILNELVADCGLGIESMSIGQYGKIDIDTLKRVEEEPAKTEDPTTLQSVVSSTMGEDSEETQTVSEQTVSNPEEEKEDFLLGCQVSLNVNGSYDNFLKLLSVLKAESTCIEVSAINLQTNDRSVDAQRNVAATVELLVYGIEDTMVEGKDK